MDFKIIGYSDEYQTRVKALNYEWLKKYDLWEPLDDAYLDDPQGMILDKGGCIFLAKADGNIVGTVSLVPEEPGVMEICKLAVTEEMQGQKIGRRLMEKCIEEGRKKGMERLILFTNSRLKIAQILYHSMGFKPVNLSDKYEVADTKLELYL